MKATIESCIKHQAKLVFIDNVYMYDKSAIPNMTEDSPVNPSSKKGLVRKEIAEMLLKAVAEKKINALIARAPDFYGPGNQNSYLIQVVYNNLIKGKNANKKISVLPMFLIRILGLFMPFMREMPEMMYQYNRDYFFDSIKFKKQFNFRPTSYQMGVKQIVNTLTRPNLSCFFIFGL